MTTRHRPGRDFLARPLTARRVAGIFGIPLRFLVYVPSVPNGHAYHRRQMKRRGRR